MEDKLVKAWKYKRDYVTDLNHFWYDTLNEIYVEYTSEFGVTFKFCFNDKNGIFYCNYFLNFKTEEIFISKKVVEDLITLLNKKDLNEQALKQINNEIENKIKKVFG